MWQISFILVPILVGVLLPWVISVSVTENGKFKKGKFFCKCPTVYRLLCLSGVLIFSVLLLVMYITDKNKHFDFVYFLILLCLLIFLFPCFICFRYKIVLDINKNEILIYSLFIRKKHISLTTIYSQETKGEIIIVKDLDNKKLFYNVTLLAGYPIIDACLRVIMENNRKQEQIDVEKLKTLIQRKN